MHGCIGGELFAFVGSLGRLVDLFSLPYIRFSALVLRRHLRLDLRFSFLFTSIRIAFCGVGTEFELKLGVDGLEGGTHGFSTMHRLVFVRTRVYNILAVFMVRAGQLRKNRFQDHLSRTAPLPRMLLILDA